MIYLVAFMLDRIFIIQLLKILASYSLILMVHTI